MTTNEHIDTIVIGGGQSGLSMGYHLAKRGVPFVILDANERVGHAWRSRWDSLRLFTPAWYTGLDGMRFNGKGRVAPTKDEMADYLEAYAARFDLPIRKGVKVDSVSRQDGVFVVQAGDQRFEADQVVIATGAAQNPWTPPFADQLDPRIVQMHSYDYRNVSQLQDGGVLLVGAGNSGADIGMDVVREHPTWVAGRHPGHIPPRIDKRPGCYTVHVVRFLGHHVLTLRNPIGRKVIPKMMKGGDPLIRIKPKDMLAAGIERVPRVEGVRDGLPLLEDGRVLDVANVIWCTGFHHSFSWIDLPIVGDDGRPKHERGVATSEPGLYFLGLEYQFAASSDVITGVGRDAAYLAKRIARQEKSVPRRDTDARTAVSLRGS